MTDGYLCLTTKLMTILFGRGFKRTYVGCPRE